MMGHHLMSLGYDQICTCPMSIYAIFVVKRSEAKSKTESENDCFITIISSSSSTLVLIKNINMHMTVAFYTCKN